jgi:hypothetical protein
MSLLFEIKANSTYPPIRGQVVTANKEPLSLSGASVRFHMKDQADTIIVDAAASIESPSTDGIVRYDWEAADTSLAGTYCGEFEITLSSGKVLSVPKSRNIEIIIYEDIT